MCNMATPDNGVKEKSDDDAMDIETQISIESASSCSIPAGQKAPRSPPKSCSIPSVFNDDEPLTSHSGIPRKLTATEKARLKRLEQTTPKSSSPIPLKNLKTN